MKNPFRKTDLSQSVSQINLKDVLSGNIFTKAFFRRHALLLLLITFFILIYIGNGLRAQHQQQQIVRLQKQINESRELMLDLSREYTMLTKRSSINYLLQQQNSRVHESSYPVILIK
ncbi:MAG: FtsL-like putative cell division protein [Paludibacter sp.]|nr:FtsL-like putative cell division protein [Bacteroidales bacterium]MCM1068354.1 FtsL-like putative cell division protein [Prevotella sp.]MCM1354018.1 FtsL-like putative cell division protein [Bacteroides sp.]MCM1442140.1 FtsL-like putative cell division protein [Muribaculum sp.]MCM1481967.1 FtsL-like putative cell division protein [Paludibacter sp.]